ncbi:MAG TPA: hypothetical protein VG839_03695 [Asticcacaulis sp.]|nr:hypothetical protein [Asticcacaulis sp.]
METHKSIFSLLSGNMKAYTISWVSTFFTSIVNALWTTHVFHYDFVSNIDGALASQIGIILLNEIYLLFSVIASRKYLFGIGTPVNLALILMNAGFICLLIYAPMTAFKMFAALSHIDIAGHSPLYDQINGISNTIVRLAAGWTHVDLAQLQSLYGKPVGKGLSILSGLIALWYVRSFFKGKKAA